MHIMAKKQIRQGAFAPYVIGNDSIELSEAMPPTAGHSGKAWPRAWKGMGRRRCCKQLDCSLCTSDTPGEILVVLADISDDSCSDCETLNDSYVCKRGDVTYEGDTELGCSWGYEFESSACGVCSPTPYPFVGIDVYFYYSFPNYKMGVCLRESPFVAADPIWEITSADLVDCADWEDVVNSWWGNSGVCDQCDFTGSTATVSAI